MHYCVTWCIVLHGVLCYMVIFNPVIAYCQKCSVMYLNGLGHAILGTGSFV